MRAWCPTCWEDVIVNGSGACSWCDTSLAHRPERPGHARTGTGTPRPYARMPHHMTEGQLDECYRLYTDEGLSLRQVASRMQPDTSYASVGSMANSLHHLFRSRGWLVRRRVVASIAAHAKHGRARRGKVEPSYRSEMALARGAARGMRCKGTRTNARGVAKQGLPCLRAALAGGEYCSAHEPALAEERRQRMAALRSRQRPPQPGVSQPTASPPASDRVGVVAGESVTANAHGFPG